MQSYKIMQDLRNIQRFNSLSERYGLLLENYQEKGFSVEKIVTELDPLFSHEHLDLDRIEATIKKLESVLREE